MKPSTDPIGRETLALIDPESSFYARMLEDRARLSALLRAPLEDAATLPLEEIEILAHRMAGAAGTFGHLKVGEAAMALEDALLERSIGPADGEIHEIRMQVKELVRSLDLALSEHRPS